MVAWGLPCAESVRAAHVPGPRACSFMMASMVGGKTNLRVDIILRTLGLDICADTLASGVCPGGPAACCSCQQLCARMESLEPPLPAPVPEEGQSPCE